MAVFVPAIIAAVLGYLLPRLIFHTTIMGSPSSDAFIFACVPIIGFFISIWLRARGEDKKGIGALLFIFAISVIFWSLYYQNFIGYTLWTEVHTDRTIKSRFIEKGADRLGFLQKVNTNPRKVDSLNAFMVPVKKDDSGHIAVTGPDPYFYNVLIESRPPPSEVKLINSELFSPSVHFLSSRSPPACRALQLFTQKG